MKILFFLILFCFSSYAQESAAFDSAKMLAADFDEYHFPMMEDWGSYRQVKKAFDYVRDARFFDWTYRQYSMKRRLTWLEPSDGCDVRAYFVVDLLKDFGKPLPNKIFAFGHFNMESIYFPLGGAVWTMHVAPIVRVGKKYYVIDPSLDFKKPLSLRKWLKKLNPQIDDIQIAVCDPMTLNEQVSCHSPKHPDREYLEGLLHNNLTAEWLNLHFNLDYDEPYRILGDLPPWKE